MSLTVREEQAASYGRHMRLLDRIEQAENKLLQLSHTATSSCEGSLQKRALDIKVWKEFPKQNLAIQFCYSCRYSVGVFSFESAKFGTSGQRHFVVSSYHTFVHRYIESIIEGGTIPHFYEVILEGAACRLYFDIEFQKLYNPTTDGVLLLDTFIQFVCFCIHSQFGIVCDRSQILDLDSTSEKKFSRHLIFHLPNAVFQNNKEVGKFIAFICNNLRTYRSTGALQLPHPVTTEASSKLASWKPNVVECPQECILDLFVRDDKGELVLICDEGVYTKNRNFRLYRSSKLGKDIDLKVAKENKFVSNYLECESDDESHKASYISKHINILLDSLISYIPFEDNMRILSFTHTELQPESNKSSSPSNFPPYGHLEPLESQECSPFPLLDDFILRLITRDNCPGKIRRATYLSEGKLVIFDITGYRYCENIGRHHKSNNVMLIANLEKMTFYQKCHDPECKRVNYRSNDMPIPPHVLPGDTGEECMHECFQDIDMDSIEEFGDEDMSDAQWMGIIQELETSPIYTAEP